MKKLLVIVFCLITGISYAQDPNLSAGTINGTITSAPDPFLNGESVSFTVVSGNNGGDMELPPPNPAGGPYTFTIVTTNIGVPSVAGTSGTNYFSTPVITPLGNGEYSMVFTQLLAIPEQEYTNITIVGKTERTLVDSEFGGYRAGYKGSINPGGYSLTNSGVDNPSASGEVGAVAITPPATKPDDATTPHNQFVDIHVLDNDTPGSSPIDPTTVMLIGPGGEPTLTVTIEDEGTYTVDPLTGIIRFTPDPDVETAITSTINYIVKDINGLESNISKITVNAPPLPVTLTTFNVVKEGKTAILNWATTAETNSNRFEIQHSATGKDWYPVGTIDSHGESTVERKYTFSDNNPSNGENLYRLKMIDNDGTFAYSRIRSVKFDGLTSQVVSIYPNPSADKVFIKDADLDQIKQASIIDMNGRAVYSSKTVNSDGINVRNLSSGTYILHITNLNGVSSSHKILIAR